MHTRTAPPVSRLMLVIVSLLFALPTAFGVFAQPGVPSPSSGQVIAHGIDSLPGSDMTWRLGILTAAPGSTAEFGTFDTGFAIGYQQPVITTQLQSGDSAYLEQGQATFHRNGSMLRVSSTSAADVAYLNIDLTTDGLDPGASWIGETFTAPSGTHDVSLTSDVTQPGESGSFTPDNDLPYMVYVFAGTLQVTDDNGVTTELMAEEAMQVSGNASLLSDEMSGAHWMIASIGATVDVPPLPTPVTTPPAASGSLVVNLFRCPDGTDPLIAPTECVVSDVLWDITISPQGEVDPASERTLANDAVAISSASYRFTGLTPGTWVIQPDMSGMEIEQRFEMTGDIVPLGGIWGVEIAAGQQSEINVYLIDSQAATGTGELILEMYECPRGTDPLSDDWSSCTLAADVPNVEVTLTTDADTIVYNTLWDAVSPEPGVLVLEDIPSGLYTLVVVDGGLWTADAVVMSGDVTWYHGSWQVTVPADGSAYVLIFHALPAPDVDDATGTLWITQVDCLAGTVDPTTDPACYPSESPWEVIVTSVVTTQQWTLFEDAYLAAPGSWALGLPVGDYTIYVVSDDTWYVSYTDYTTVYEGDTTEITVYSVEPDEP